MITSDPYGVAHVIRPGHLPEPPEPVNTRDPQEYVDKCLDCPIKEECRPSSAKCPLNAKAKKTREADERILKLIRSGWKNNDAICEELGISKSALYAAKRRLRERRGTYAR